MKRKLVASEENQLFFPKRQLRSRIPRRRRSYIPRLLFHFPSTTVDSSDFAGVVTQDVSCESSIASVSNLKPPQKRNELPRDFTHTYSRNRRRDQPVDLSEVSCVESCPGDGNRELLQLKSTSVVESGQVICKSEVSSTSPRFSVAGDCGGVILIGDEDVVGVDRDDVVLADEITNSIGNRGVFDLTCSEKFSYGLIEDVEEEEEEEEEEFVNVTSDLELGGSQYTPSSSLWSSTTGSEFSEKSIGYETTLTFHLLNQFKQQFYRSTLTSPVYADDQSSPLLGLGNEEDEESYRLMRRRERRQVYLRDYSEEYCNITGYGEQVIKKRLQMVHWIVEQSTNNELQMETMFLGVGLLDRFLSKGYFKNMMYIQIAGIACLTLATRIEENQPYNCISASIEPFCIGKNTYDRSQVVAMEWLVMEVLNFQCFLPTSYNFLWYYLRAARANKKMEKTARYLGVLALIGQQQLCFWPSVVAAGLVMLASIVEKEDASCHLIAAIHAREKDKSLPECIKSLEWVLKYI